jgi:rsbT antagonist protein RsbS
VTTVPVVRIGNALVAAMQEDIEDRSALELADRLASEVAANGAAMVLLDVSAAQVVDSFISRVIVDIARVCRLLGAQVTVVGMRPAVAITLVELGLTLDGVRTALSIDDAMNALEDGAGGDTWRV